MFLSGVKECLSLRQKISQKLKFSIPDVDVRTSNGLKGEIKRSVSVISTTLNEEQNIEPWLYSLLGQSFSPSEVVICDGGSSDNTVQLITKWKHEHPKLKVVLTSSPGANIAKGRNEAVKSASGEILLFSDVGSLPCREWVKELAQPFLSDPNASVCLGRSECQSDSEISKAVCRLILQEESEIIPRTYLASGRSIGVSKAAFQKVGAFPEDLTLAGEDTLFNIKLRENIKEGFYYSPGAVSNWIPPRRFMELWKMLYRYAKGDAEAGIFYKDHLSRVVELVAVLIGIILTCYSLKYAISRSQYGVLLISLVCIYFTVSPILAYQTKLKGFSFKQKLFAPFILISAQAIGFISGLTFAKK